MLGLRPGLRFGSELGPGESLLLGLAAAGRAAAAAPRRVLVLAGSGQRRMERRRRLPRPRAGLVEALLLLLLDLELQLQLLPPFLGLLRRLPVLGGGRVRRSGGGARSSDEFLALARR